MTPYSYFAGAAVQEIFARASAQQQRVLLDGFSIVAEHPFRAADWIEHDSDGRPIQSFSTKIG